MFKYKNDKGAMRIVDTSNDKEYRLSMPHEVVQLVELLNAAQQPRAADGVEPCAIHSFCYPSAIPGYFTCGCEIPPRR